METPSYSGKKVLILGLGRYEHGSGFAAVKFFLRQGADLVITDLQSQDELSHQVKRVQEFAQSIQYKGSIDWVMGEHREEDIVGADLVIPNPAVPITSEYVQLALKNKIPVESEMTLFFKECPAEIIGVTGTRGKSTSAALIAHILEAYPQNVYLGGNIGKGSPLDFHNDLTPDDRVVLELSNFMLEYLDLHKMSPHVAVLLNVFPDHLNRYDGDMDAYAASKEVITRYQTDKDLLIVNEGNSYTKEIAGRSQAKKVWFNAVTSLKDGYYMDHSFVVEAKKGENVEIIDANTIPLRGKHNFNNILAAVACVMQLEEDVKPLQKHIGSFPSLHGRLQFIDEFNGVTFINDTTSTTPVAAIAAIDSLNARSIVLIAGGNDKQLPIEDLITKLALVKSIIWLPGTGTERMYQHLPETMDQVKVNTMNDAVKQAFARASSGDVVLLSPGFTSFGSFKNEYDRGDQFDQAVEQLKQTTQL